MPRGRPEGTVEQGGAEDLRRMLAPARGLLRLRHLRA
nr:MAG TPA: hypothetical protein [Caudoviricetes sp.]